MKNKNAEMEHAFVTEVQTWGSADQMLDVIVLNDGKVVAITATNLAVYDDMPAFEAGTARGIIEI